MCHHPKCFRITCALCVLSHLMLITILFLLLWNSTEESTVLGFPELILTVHGKDKQILSTLWVRLIFRGMWNTFFSFENLGKQPKCPFCLSWSFLEFPDYNNCQYLWSAYYVLDVVLSRIPSHLYLVSPLRCAPALEGKK